MEGECDMKKVLAVTAVLLVLTFALAAVASAQLQPNWRFYLKADDGNVMNAMAAMTIGVHSGSKDGYGVDGTTSDTQDAKASIPSTSNTRGVVGVFDNKVWTRHLQSPRLPTDPAYGPGMPAPNGHTFGDPNYEPYHKIWDLRVFCLPTNSSNPTNILRLSFTTINSTVMPPSTLPFIDNSGTGPNCFWLRMVDNKGVEGAPANGTVWSIPIPTAYSSTAWFSLTLPNRVISAANETTILSEGYEMQFFQTQAVPEPASLMALAGGLVGLASYGIRRRRV
jgi:hypothetical protein